MLISFTTYRKNKQKATQKTHNNLLSKLLSSIVNLKNKRIKTSKNTQVEQDTESKKVAVF